MKELSKNIKKLLEITKIKENSSFHGQKEPKYIKIGPKLAIYVMYIGYREVADLLPCPYRPVRDDVQSSDGLILTELTSNICHVYWI